MLRVLLVLPFLSFFACTLDRSPEEVTVSRNDSTRSLPAPQKSNDSRSTRGATIEYRSPQGTLPVSLNEQELRQTFAVATNALTYKFSYIAEKREGPIDFANGKAVIKIEKLPVGQTGSLRFEIYEDSKLKIYGYKDGVTLQAGTNSERLVLIKVDENTRGNLSIDLKLEDIRSIIDGRPLPEDPQTPPQTPPQGPAPELSAVGKAAMAVIVQHCSECHHQGRPNVLSELPMRATFSNDAKAILAQMIATIENNTMPPGPRDRLTSDEIAKLKAWQAVQ